MIRCLAFSLALLFVATPAQADPFSIEPIGEVKGLRRAVTDFRVQGHTLFLVTSGKSELVIVDVRAPDQPKRLFKGYFKRKRLSLLAVSPEGIVYGVGETGLTIFDARRPERTRILGQHETLELPSGDDRCFIQQNRGQLFLRKDRLYVASGVKNLLCVDVSNPVKPKLLAQVKFPGGLPGGVQRFSGTRVLVNHGKGVSPLDLAVPTRARALAAGHRDYIAIEGIKGTLHDVAISTDLRYAYASAPGPTLYTLDLKESKVVRTVSFAKTLPGTELYSLALSPDERVLAAATGTGLVAFNVVDPLNARLAGNYPGTGRGRVRFYGDLIFAGGHGYTLTINRVTGTENVGTVGETTTMRGESSEHFAKRPGRIVHPKDAVAGPQSYEIGWRGVRRPGRGHYTTYTVAYRGLYDVVWAKDTVDSLGGNARHVLSGLEPNMYYLARVRTVLEDGEYSPWSEIHQFLTPSPAPTWAKEWLTDVTSTTATLTWTVPEQAQKAYVAFYIFYRAAGGQWQTTEAREEGVFKTTLIGLKPQTAYQVRVQGNYGALNSSPYTTVNILVTKPK